jgi:hypothetical protein
VRRVTDTTAMKLQELAGDPAVVEKALRTCRPTCVSRDGEMADMQLPCGHGCLVARKAGRSAREITCSYTARGYTISF